MKKLIIALCLVFCLAPCVQAGMVIAGGESSSETYLLKYDADHASGTDYAYISSGTGSIQGSITSTTASSAQNHTSGGTYSLLVGGTNDQIAFASASSYINTSEGSLEIWVYCDGAWTNGGMSLFEISSEGHQSTDMLRAYIATDGTVYLRHEGNNTVVSIITDGAGGTVPTGAWARLRFRWSVTSNITGIQINSNAWRDDSDGDSVTAFANAADYIIFGDDVYNSESSSDSQYIDDAQIIGSYNDFND